ncbi:BTAD domain-containing putative transcriptional regulator [Kitasatospora sp. NBC_01302]|uniref:BTAD domain-containing putative transcriptional regulator n=1 Tax=Kitasatospora sp. NBC_01302 TaxID=2903575 RepID=UPI002E0D5A93|nr:winged helix-turn-helix domain-containing protein [Kitasatospora sp. NBC_01302]
MLISMLGPLEVRADAGGGGGARIEVGGARLRALLIVLALEPGRVVSAESLIDGIWDQDPPMGAANALQALVSRLRRALPVAVESHPAGYRLVVEPDAVDVIRFERLAADGRAALERDTGAAARLLREALELWRGPALLEVAGADFFRGPVARLSELRVAALEDRVEADLRLGHGRELTGELAALVAEYPLRERLVGALMRALVASGRPAEALTAYERAREVLADELGADPSPELSALHTALLRGELATSAQPAPAPAPAPPPAPRGPLTNLRAGLASFVGREEDLAQVSRLVGEHRLTTLTGPGGAGKTRLSIEAARPLLDRFPDGVWLVELAPLTDGADLPQAVLAALGPREQAQAGGTPLDRLRAVLRSRETLLLLDNCEHLIEAAAELVDQVLGECPGLRILATSREPLGLTGEALWPVRQLALPAPDAGVAEALGSPAVRLLEDRAATAGSGFTVSEQTVAAVGRICRAVDGMPLAIELAAARLRTMSAEQVAARLDDRFRLLTGGARTAPRQHRTLRAVVDWSWELLSEAERILLRRLAVFAGGATLEAAEQVCADRAGSGLKQEVDQADVLDLISSLTDKSLLVATGDGRYRMLETIKAYGLEKLTEAGERETVRRAHADWFAELAERADPYLHRAEQLEWLALLAADHDNLTAALRGALAAGEARSAVRLVAGCGWYWWLSGHKAEGAELAARALALPDGEQDEARAVACAVTVMLAMAGLGDERQIVELLHEAQLLAELTGSRNPIVRFARPLNQLLVRDEEPGAVVRVWDELADEAADEDPWVLASARLEGARALLNIGGPPAEAEHRIRASLAGFRAIGERWGISFALSVLADLIARRGDHAAAVDLYEQAIAVTTELGGIEDRLHTQGRQAELRWLLGDRVGSASVLAQAEREARTLPWTDALAGLAHSTAEIARWSGRTADARAELARADEITRSIVVHPVFRAMLLDSLAHLDATDGDLTAARTHRRTALDLALTAGHAPTIAQTLVGLADQALRQGSPSQAARLLAAAHAVRGGPDLSRPDAPRVEAATRTALGDHYAEAARAGAAVTSGTAGLTPATPAAVRELAAVTLAGSAAPGGAGD